MRKLVLLLVVLAFTTQAQISNWNGYLDTAMIKDSIGTDDIVYTKSFSLSKGRYNRLTILATDTTEAGFADDSLEFDYGYQSGRLVLDSGIVENGSRITNIDTAWDVRVKLGDFSNADLGTMTEASIDSTGALTIGTSNIDTLNVDGLAYMTVQYSQLWDVLVRYWLQGNAANSTEPVKIIIQHNQQTAELVKQQ